MSLIPWYIHSLSLQLPLRFLSLHNFFHRLPFLSLSHLTVTIFSSRSILAQVLVFLIGEFLGLPLVTFDFCDASEVLCFYNDSTFICPLCYFYLCTRCWSDKLHFWKIQMLIQWSWSRSDQSYKDRSPHPS